MASHRPQPLRHASAAPRAAAAPRRGGPFARPLVSTIDRYVLGAFLKNYFISLLVLIGLYVVLDMVFNFDEFVQVSGARTGEEAVPLLTTLRLIASYYFFQAFRVFSYLAGVIPVVAAAFTLMRMSRSNELVALLAAGVPLGRIARPVVMAAFVLNFVLLLVNQELIVPTLIDKLTRDRGEAASQMENRVLRAMPDGDEALLFAGRYTPPSDAGPAVMQVVDVFARRDGQIAQTSADRATFDPASQSWRLENGTRSIVARPGTARVPAEPIDTLETTVNPETIALFVSRGDFVDLLSSTRIRELLAQNTAVGRLDLMRVRDARWANYILNVVLVLLTIPCVLTREPMQLKTATGRVFVLVGACMATIFICQNLAGQPPGDPDLAAKWPLLMAWLPIFIFSPVAIWMLDRLKT